MHILKKYMLILFIVNIYNYFLNKNKNQNLKYFFSYFTNKEKVGINKFYYQNQVLSIKKDFIYIFYKNFISKYEIFLESIINNNELSLKSIYEKNIKYKKFNWIYFNGSSNLEDKKVYFYKYLTNNTKLASTLLLCKKDTTSEEIISFVNIAILSPYHIFFVWQELRNNNEVN